jgi:hypothetical protein
MKQWEHALTDDRGTSSPEHTELNDLYELIHIDEMFVKELAPGDGGYVAAVGDLRGREYRTSIIAPGPITPAEALDGITPRRTDLACGERYRSDTSRRRPRGVAAAQRERAVGERPRFATVRRHLGMVVRRVDRTAGIKLNERQTSCVGTATATGWAHFGAACRPE